MLFYGDRDIGVSLITWNLIDTLLDDWQHFNRHKRMGRRSLNESELHMAAPTSAPRIYRIPAEVRTFSGFVRARGTIGGPRNGKGERDLRDLSTH